MYPFPLSSCALTPPTHTHTHTHNAPQSIPELAKGLNTASKGLKDLQGRTAPVVFVDASKGCEEGTGAFSWPLLEVGGFEAVANAMEGAEFFHNKVRKASKETGKPELMAFANAYRDALKAMGAWIKDNAKMGLMWNAKGGDWKAFGGAVAPAGSPAAVAAAPAPAPAAVAASPKPAAAAAGAAQAAPSLAAMFSQIGAIDQSSGRTEGLRQVTKEMKAAAKAEPPVVPVRAAGPPKAKETVVPGLKLGEPKLALNRATLRWEVEFQSRDTAAASGGIIVIDGTEAKQEVYIYGCRDCAIDIRSKVKGVRIDQCGGVTVLMSSALSGVEVVNSRKMKIQVREKVPSVAIDKTDGIMVGLTWPARDAVITTSKSSEMNVTFPVSEAADADWVEQPIPEQFVSKLTAAGKLHTGVSELYSS